MSDRRSAHRKAARGRGVPPSALPPLLVASAVGGSTWAATVTADVPAGGAGAVGVLGVAGAAWWAWRRDRAGAQAWAAEHAGLAEEVHQRHNGRLVELAGQMTTAITVGQADLADAVHRAERGEPVPVPGPRGIPLVPDGPLQEVAVLLRDSQAAALDAVRRAAASPAPGADSGAELLVSVARRLHGLINLTLEKISDAQQLVEDPEQLDGLFGVDNLVTRTRRSSESIAVLGGHTPRQVKSPMGLVGVLRQAIAETKEFRRARLAVAEQIAYLEVPGYAAASVIHVLAELIENATKFSAPDTQVVVRASVIPAGLVVEVEDRGLTMHPRQLAEMNQLLRRPKDADKGELLKRGTIGLLVAALIAERLEIRVELQTNILGGTQALVVLPEKLVSQAAPPQRPASRPVTAANEAGVPVPGGAVLAPGQVGISAPAAVGEVPRPGAPPALPRRAGSPRPGQPFVRDTQRPDLPRRVPSERPSDQPIPDIGESSTASPAPSFVGAWQAGKDRHFEEHTSPPPGGRAAG